MSKLSRLGWGSMAVLFLVTSLTLTILVILQMVNPDPVPQQLSCSFSGTIPAPKLPVPAVYKPEAKASQLIISDLVAGTGAEASPSSCVTVKYSGNLASGTVFDQNYSQPMALQFQLGSGYVIPGWEQGIPGMKAGGERRLIIPASLAYGSKAQGSIPANSDLIFTVKLISIQ